MKDNTDNKTEELFTDLSTAIAKVQGKEVNIYASAPKSKTTNGFVMLFYDALSKYVYGDKLNMSDMKVIMSICQVLEYGNTISLNQSKLADYIGVEKATFSRSIKKLLKLGLILKSDLGLFLNPAIIVKGRLEKISSIMWEEALDVGFISPITKVSKKQQKYIDNQEQANINLNNDNGEEFQQE